jgi:hypothetical protein
MRATGVTTDRMAKAKWKIRKARTILAITEMERCMGTENTFGRTVQFIKDSGRMDALMARASTNGTMVANVKANGKIIKLKAMPRWFTRMAGPIKVISTKTSNMVMVSIPGPVESSMMATGYRENNTARDTSLLWMVKSSLVFGKTARK